MSGKARPMCEHLFWKWVDRKSTCLQQVLDLIFSDTGQTFNTFITTVQCFERNMERSDDVRENVKVG